MSTGPDHQPLRPTLRSVATGSSASLQRGISAGGAARVIDVSGLIVAPGFIDIHSHLDPLFRLPAAETKLRQGVTTALGGPDGGGPWPLGLYLDSAETLGVGVNVAFLVGHNTIRREVMGMDNRPPTDAELATMRQMVTQATDEGAFGISTGLRYLPGAYSNVDEVVALSEMAASRGGVYTSHLREGRVGSHRGRGGSHRDKPSRGTSGGAHSPQGSRASDVGVVGTNACHGRFRACGGRECLHRSVPVYGDVLRYRDSRPSLGEGRRCFLNG